MSNRKPLALLILLGIPVSLASIQNSSPSNTPEEPVIKHSPSNAKARAADSPKQPSSGNVVTSVAHAPSAQEANSAAQNGNYNSDAEPYRVKIVSQPTPTDTPLFIVYVIFTGLATLINSAIFFAILRQNKINWRQAKINLRAARAAVRAASAASRNAEEIIVSNKINREAMHCGQRAYVWFSPAKPRMFGIKDRNKNYEMTKWHIQLRVENAGNTPTKDLRWRYNWMIRTDELPENFTYSDQGIGGDVPLLIGPRAAIYTGPIELSNEDIQKIRIGILRLYIYGWATYHDVFDSTPLHRTEFCFEAFPRYMADAKELEVRIQLMFHRRHNSHT